MRILGIDPGLNTSGYGLIDGEGLRIKLVEAGFIRTNPKNELESRLGQIHKAVDKIIKKFKPEIMILEKLYAHWRHPTTACKLGHVRGIICLAARQNDLGLNEYAATRIKKAIVGNGHASKLQMQRMIQGLLKLEALPKPPDIADALALAIAHSYIASKKI